MFVMASVQLANLYAFGLHVHARWVPPLFILPTACAVVGFVASPRWERWPPMAGLKLAE